MDKNSSCVRKKFVLWEIKIPPEYPNLHVSTELKEVLLHIGSKLKFMGSQTYSKTIDGWEDNYDITIERYEYIGCDKFYTNEVLNKFREALNILKKVSKNRYKPYPWDLFNFLIYKNCIITSWL